jgi:two-component system sensor histidine kinase KdpD
MAGALSAEQVAQAARTYLGNRGCDASLLFATAAGDLSGPSHGDHTFGSLEHSFALSAFRRNEVVEADSLAGTGIAIAFFPLRAPTGVRGILAVAPRNDDAEALRERRASLEAVASLVALAVERLHYAEVARAAELQVTEERLRGSVLSSLSHDLRTPLTTLVGLADSLAQARDRLPAEVAETAGIIRDQAGAMHRLLSNLLEMARLQVPNAVLRREWQPFEEVVGSSLRLAEAWLGTRQVTVDLPAGLPLLEFDAVLIERVLCNLLENAVKYSPEGSRIELAGRVDADWLTVSVGNEGPGFPPGRLDEMFDLFVRGHGEPSIAGVGLGLAICKAIVAAHGGSIRAENRPGGACVRFTLPLGTPPAMVEEAP